MYFFCLMLNKENGFGNLKKMNMIFKNGLIWENAHEAKSQVRNYLFWKSTTVDTSRTANHLQSLQDRREFLGRWGKFCKLTYWALVFFVFFFTSWNGSYYIAEKRFKRLKNSSTRQATRDAPISKLADYRLIGLW